MISLDEALGLIEKHRTDWGVETRALRNANGRILASDIFADFTQPAFPTSKMDGYALRKVDLGSVLTVVGESRAGRPYDGRLREDETVRIFTGAILPEGADIVEIQEYATVDHHGDRELLSFTQISKGRDYVRLAGSDFKQRDRLFDAGTRITPGVMMALANANVSDVLVKKMPTMALLRGGDELKPLGSRLKTGQIIDSNGPSLIALMTGWGIDVEDLGIVSDNPDDIHSRLSKCEAEIIVTVGGASVGDYDHMKSSTLEIGFNPIFATVAVKPGKPVWLSHRKEQLILGLPGNPHSAWSCAHLFLAHLLGRGLTWRTYHLTDGLGENGIREQFIRGKLDTNGGVSPLNAQTGISLSIAQADVLIRRAPLADELAAGQKVTCLHIHY